jgi:hypothetical protein
VSHQANAALSKGIFQSSRQGASISNNAAVTLKMRNNITTENAEVQAPISRQAE